MTKYCSFFGHRNLYGEKIEERLRAEIINCIEKKDINAFLLGGYGEFDLLCAKVLRELKKQYTQIKTYLVLAYLDKKFNKEDKKYNELTFNELIYPELENVPKKLAIIRRNSWIVKNSDFIIFYITHLWGGAGKMFEIAKKSKKDFININSTKIV